MKRRGEIGGLTGKAALRSGVKGRGNGSEGSTRELVFERSCLEIKDVDVFPESSTVPS